MLPQIETELLQSTTESSKFSKYVKDHTDVLSCLIRKRRRLNDNDIVPARLSTNQSECVNNILNAKKNSLGHGKKDDMSLPIFVRDVWAKVISEKWGEVEKALYGQSHTYRLIRDARYIE